MSTQPPADFLQHLRASQLLDEAQLQTAVEWATPADGDPPTAHALARKLVTDGLLTPFQARCLLAGRTQFFIGPYTLVDRIGTGGAGRVYKAIHQFMQRTVAIKVLTQSKRHDPEAQVRFLREARACAKLDHPNIVRAYDVAQEERLLYLVLEYVEGPDLSERIKTRGRLDPMEAARIAQQVAMALEHARQRGIVHRDIKPANILIAEDGTAKVLDMGLARVDQPTRSVKDSTTLTHEGAVMGTLDYLAPEQAMDSHDVDTRADIYSLGCTLYHMLTGQVPFPGGTAAQKLMKHQMRDPVPVTKLAPGVPPDLARIVNTMMAKRPEDRYETPAEVVRVLGALLGGHVGGLPESARPDRPQAAPPPQALSQGFLSTLPPDPPEPAFEHAPGTLSFDVLVGLTEGDAIASENSALSTDGAWGLAPEHLEPAELGRVTAQAKSLLANWRALRSAIEQDSLAPHELRRLTRGILTAYQQLPISLETPDSPGHVALSLLEAGVPPADLRREATDLAHGEAYLAEFLAFLEGYST